MSAIVTTPARAERPMTLFGHAGVLQYCEAIPATLKAPLAESFFATGLQADSDLLSQRLPQTGFLSKSVLLTKVGVALINNHTPGDKVLVFADGVGFGIVDRNGQGNYIDAFKKSFAGILRKHGFDPEKVAVEQGGDEFAFVVARERFDDFTRALREINTFCVNSGFANPTDSNFREMARALEVRTQTRLLRSKYSAYLEDQKQHGQSAFHLSFEAFLKQEAMAKGLAIDGVPGLSPVEIQHTIASETATQIARERGACFYETSTLLTLRVGCVALPAHPEVEDYQLALARGDFIIHENGRTNGPLIDERIKPINARSEKHRVEMKSDTRAEMINAERLLELFQQEQSAIGGIRSNNWQKMCMSQLLARIVASDPALPGVLKCEYVGDKPVQRFLAIADQGLRGYVTVLDITGFGAVNNNLGYTIGNALKKATLETFLRGYENRDAQPLLAVTTGGKIVIFSTEPLLRAGNATVINMANDAILETLTTNPRQALENLVTLKIEIGEKRVPDGTRKVQKIPLVEITTGALTITPDMTLGDFYNAAKGLSA
jgi:GGDEF domain-containing protein